jgi:Omp85 superfamily domain
MIAMRWIACAGVGVLLNATPLHAQQPVWSTCSDGVAGKPCGAKGLSRAEREEVEALYNAPATRRDTAPFSLARDSVVRGSLAILGGPVRISGTIEGSLLVLNGDLHLDASATVTGDVAVLGGTVTGADSARIGVLRNERDSVLYSIDDGVLNLEAPIDEIWRLFGIGEPRNGIGVRLAAARTYNRVEGLPVELGPRLRYHLPFGTVAADLFGILRTGDRLEWTGNNVGHSARVELRFGRREHWSVGGRFYDVVSPVESWQLSEEEVGLAAFLAHSDYRDYYDRHGGSGAISWRDGRAVRVSVELASERWQPRRTLDPFSLWKNDDSWRENPAFDRAKYQRVQLKASYDTRTDPIRPRTGWWLQGEYEYGDGKHQSFGTEIAAPVASANQRVRYGRGMLDLRRYSRLSPTAQLNARVLVGGRLHGDALPLQRRLSLSGPGANSGFGFRDRVTTPDRLQCSGALTLPGSPALCDAMVMLSVDYRHDIKWLVDLFGGARLIQTDRSGYGGWVLFTDTGRGWLTKSRARLGPDAIDAPSGLEALQTSVGAGLEIGQGGVYVAKAVGAPSSRGVQVFVRLVRRY